MGGVSCFHLHRFFYISKGRCTIEAVEVRSSNMITRRMCASIFVLLREFSRQQIRSVASNSSSVRSVALRQKMLTEQNKVVSMHLAALERLFRLFVNLIPTLIKHTGTRCCLDAKDD
jgi:hypothetical protein